MLKRICLNSIICCLALFAACDDIDNEFTTSVTYFVFDNGIHQDATLASACNLMSPGTFCIIKKRMTNGGAVYFDFTNAAGKTTSQLANAIDLKRTCVLGYNNSIIVGYSKYDPYPFYAYDRECPNCFDPDAVPVRSKPLSISDDGMATCPVCHRKYDLNNRGVTTDGKKLTRYRPTVTGAYGVLSVY